MRVDSLQRADSGVTLIQAFAPEMQYSLKKKSALLWKTGLSMESIQEHLRNVDPEDWCVCPLGEAGSEVCATVIVENPDFFEAQAKEYPEVPNEELIEEPSGHAELTIEEASLEKLKAIHFWVKLVGIVVLAWIALNLLFGVIVPLLAAGMYPNSIEFFP